jgi:predicted nucleic acid-binding protein
MIDSSVLVAAERGKLDFDDFLRRYAGHVASISAITASELLHGVHRAATPDQLQRRRAFVEGLLGQFTVAPVDLAVARRHAEWSAALRAGGKTVGAHDLLIAATAASRGDAVVTRDARSFPIIPGLLYELV